ncbi:MAG TPA: Clp protease N-terminal domain-containing protein [Actinomycetota bacterium]|nr:Clp protease N-terminal domain-containing protein [Actinomycetota bacterium]
MRVTECAQQAVRHARGEAGRLGHDRIGTEHLLLALLRDQECLASVILGERGVEVETLRRRVEETVGPGQGDGPPPEGTLEAARDLPTTKPFTIVLGLAGREALELEQDRLGTEHLLLGLAREGDGVAARVLEDLGAGLLQLREALLSVYSAGADPEPLPADRGPPPWEPPAGARLERVLPLVSEHPLPSGDLLVLLSLEIWSDWFDLRYAIAHATPEPEGDLPRPSVLGRCEVSDRAGTEYTNRRTVAPGYGMVRSWQHTFVPAPPPGTEVLELRFNAPPAAAGDGPPLAVSTVVL